MKLKMLLILNVLKCNNAKIAILLHHLPVKQHKMIALYQIDGINGELVNMEQFLEQTI